MRDDDLDVALCAERARLDQRLLVEDAAAVHVLPGDDVVQRVGDAVELGKEIVTVNV
jgi:hypothetical protein